MRVAAPVAERLDDRALAPGYVDLDGFVVVVTRDGPVLPNGVGLVGSGVWDPTLRLVAPALEPDNSYAGRDPESLGAELIGRGPGLTPEGDDVIAGLAAVVASGPWPRACREAWVGALLGDDLRRRTTSLSATLLELAGRGMGPEPLQAVLAGRTDALARLRALGHTSGRAYARGAATGLAVLAA